MSKPVRVEWTETVAELEAGYRAKPNVERRKRWGALWRVQAGDRVADAARAVGVRPRSVERWLAWSRTEGLVGVVWRVPGHRATGQPHQLTTEQRGRCWSRAGSQLSSASNSAISGSIGCWRWTPGRGACAGRG